MNRAPNSSFILHPSSFNHCDRDDEENESIAMYVSLAGAPVTFGDDDGETRFKSAHLRAYHGVRAGAGIAIPTASGNFGALLAYANAQRVFSDYEIGFLRSTANLVGEALERARVESLASRASGEQFAVEISIEPVGSGAIRRSSSPPA